jgi:putative MATE family efflux protein
MTETASVATATDLRREFCASTGSTRARPVEPENLIREAILHGALLPTMLRLALPTVAVLLAQTTVGLAEAYYVSFLGTDAIAGVTLVFPVFMLMAMTSNGGIGGGVAAAVARAIGGERRDDADALAAHALVLAALFGILFTAGTLLLGPALYRALGGEGAALHAALAYSAWVFAGSVPMWIVNLLSAALRGAGNVRVPAVVTLVGAGVVVALSPALIFGFGPLPRLGIAGAGVAVGLYYAAAAVVLLHLMRSGRIGLTLKRVRLEARLFRDILHVGLVSALGGLQSNLSVVLVTGAVGLFGTDALAGYGAASRLDYVLIPLMFGLGTAAVTMVGVNIGAGDVARARRIAWTGALLSALVTEAIGVSVALFPDLWLCLFTRDPAVLASGESYLRLVAPFYGAVGLGFLLYFASQGAGRVVFPFFAGTVRLVVAAGVGWFVVGVVGVGLSTLFAVVAAASVLYGASMAVIILATPWSRSGIGPGLIPRLRALLRRSATSAPWSQT